MKSIKESADTKPAEAMTEAHTPTPWRRIAQGGSSTIVSSAKPQRNDTRIPGYGYKDDAHCIAYPFIQDDGRYRLDFVCFSHADAEMIVLAVNSHALLQRVADAARALDTSEDFSEPIGPGQDPQDWDAYNALRRELGKALADLNSKD